MLGRGRSSGKHGARRPRCLPCGDDAEAKLCVIELLESFGWPAERVVDLGGIRSARGTEMYLALWLSLWGALATGYFNIGVVHAEG